MGIEPTYPTWKAGALPLSYTCLMKRTSEGINSFDRANLTYSYLKLQDTWSVEDSGPPWNLP